MVENTEKTQTSENTSNWADKIEVSEGNSAQTDSLADGKILNQDEIDSLLGYHNEEDAEYRSMKTGVRAILNGSMVSYERLPMLEIVFEYFSKEMKYLIKLISSSKSLLNKELNGE